MKWTTESGAAREVTEITAVERLALRPREAARALGISERSLRSLQHRLPRLRVGRAVLFPVEGLRRWVRDQAKTGHDDVDNAVNAALAQVNGPSPS